MFTGIVEEMGLVGSVKRNGVAAELTIMAKVVIEDVHIGDSICVDGICLTVTRFGNLWFSADVGAETLEITTLSNITEGKKVNLERALRMNDRIGGHMVSGHIDGIALLKKIERETASWKLYFNIPENLSKNMIKKGSVAVNGVSLTIADIYNEELIISVIPHTYANTNLSMLANGEKVNIETDLIGKYIVNYLRDIISSPGTSGKESRINENFLKEHGFIG